MERSEVVRLYDEGYAEAYDLRFLLSPWARSGADFEEERIREVLDADEDPRWLDVACGTGYFLARFPGVPRAGMDLSPAMVAKAAEANPDAEFLREHDFLVDVPEWHDAWSLLTCMWTPYNYVQSVWEVEQLVANLVRWTRPGGSIFIPVMDLEDIRHVDAPYEEVPGEFGGLIALTSITWTWDEPYTGKHHEHLVAPHVGHFVRMLEADFATVEVVRYPLFQNAGPSRKAVLAKGKRPRREGVVAEVTWHPAPQPVPDEPSAEDRPTGEDAAPVEGTTDAADGATVTDAGSTGGAVGAPTDDAQRSRGGAGEVPEGPGPVGEQDAPMPPGPGEVPYTALPTRVLVGELARRANPVDARFWRGVKRKLGRDAS